MNKKELDQATNIESGSHNYVLAQEKQYLLWKDRPTQAKADMPIEVFSFLANQHNSLCTDIVVVKKGSE